MDRKRENALRKRCKRHNCTLLKDRSPGRDMFHMGGYMVIDHEYMLQCGAHFDLSLDQVETYLGS
jgi:hypothetical protein